MRKILMIMLTCGLLTSVPFVSVQAGSLDDVINEGVKSEVSENTSDVSSGTLSDSYVSADEFIESTKDASNLSASSAGATKINEGIKKIASFIVQIASYFLTAFLVVRVVLDLIYIAIPFTRSFLSNGYGGNPAAGGGSMGMQQQGMGMGGMGMGSGMGMGRYGGMGMGRYGGMGMGGMGMGSGMGMGGMGGMQGQPQGQPGANPALGRVQWISNAALNAVACESIPGPDGKVQSAYKIYAKDMTVVLVITPILLTLAITGVLTDLGFLIGELIAKAIANVGTMI